jgi:hypothetical protein
MGKYIEIKFKQHNDVIQTIMASTKINKLDICYFEVEVEDNPKDSDVVIGFCSDKEYSPQFELGKSLSSIAFHSKTGYVENANKVIFDFKLKASFGETIGKILNPIGRNRDSER